MEPQPAAKAQKNRFSQLLHDEIERVLTRRTTQENSPARYFEEAGKTAGSAVWNTMKKHSGTGVVVIGGAAIVLAELTGAAELAFGLAAGYAAYRVLRRGDSPEAALEKVLNSSGP
jgi:hypothetical protein